MLKYLKTFFLIFALSFSGAAFAQEVSSALDQVVSLDQVAEATVVLVKDGKGMTKLALTVAVLNLLVMLLKTNLAGQWFSKQKPGLKRFVLVVLGQGLGILLAMESGLSPLSAVLAGLITSGGAVSLFEAYKAVFGKKAE